MNSFEEKEANRHITLLTELGLNITQAKVYIALAKSKNLTANAISAISGVSRPDVYRVVSQLEKEGFVSTIVDSPQRFQAIPINECSSILVLRRASKTAKLKEEALLLSRDFKRNLQDEEAEEKIQFLFLPEREALYNKSEKMIKSTRESICIEATNELTLPWLSRYLSVLEEALARKVALRIMVPQLEPDHDEENPFKVLGKYSDFSLRLIPEPVTVVYGIYDHTEVLIGNDLTNPPGKYSALWSNNKNLVNLCQGYFEYAWMNAKNVSKTIT